MKDILAEMFNKAVILAAFSGAMGGVVRTLTMRDRIWPDGVINLVVGAICAVYLGPIVQPLLKMIVGPVMVAEGQLEGFTGFIVGVGGITASSFVMDIWKGARKRTGATGSGDSDA